MALHREAVIDHKVEHLQEDRNGLKKYTAFNPNKLKQKLENIVMKGILWPEMYYCYYYYF